MMRRGESGTELGIRLREGDAKAMAEVCAELRLVRGNVVAASKALGVSARTMYRWQLSHPEIVYAIKAGRESLVCFFCE